jgi:hypothetical protein
MPDEQAKLAETLDAQPYEPPKPRKSRRILLWILAVAFLLAAAVAALPIALSLRDANECQAVGAMRSYAEAQVKRRRSGAVDPGYAKELPQLRGLLPDEIIAAWGPNGRPYHGYLFREMKTIGGQPIDWSADFGISAVPAKYGVFSRRSFILMTNGTTFGHDWGRQVEFFDDYPSDPISLPWGLGFSEDE